jgi:hypothetical protein
MPSEEQLFKLGLEAAGFAKIDPTTQGTQMHQPLEVLESESDPRKAIRLTMLHLVRQEARRKFSRKSVEILLDPLQECLKEASKEKARYLLGVMIWGYDTAEKGKLFLDARKLENDPLDALISAFKSHKRQGATG